MPSPDTDLIESGLLDSLALVSLLAEIEREFGFELPLDTLEVDDFRTVESAASYVEARLCDGGHPHVSAIRPLEPDDIPGVAALYERVMRSGTPHPEPAVEDFFRETVLMQPWADPEIPSLVYDDPDAGILGFLGSHVRRLLLDGRPVRVGCSGQLVADPDAAKPGSGRAAHAQPHARRAGRDAHRRRHPTVRAMWERLGGVTLPLASMGWTRVLRPARFAAAIAGPAPGREPRRSAAVLDALAGPAHPPRPAPARARGLHRAAHQRAAARTRRARQLAASPRLQRVYLDWLFAQMEAVPERGELRRLAVRDERGDPLGWAVYYRARGGISQVQQIAALGDPGQVVDHVLWDAAQGGSVAVQGRLEPALVPPLFDRRCIFRRTEWALLRADDPELLAAITAGDSLLTRMDGEWWMGPHLIPAAAPA